jgi:hypothetical protein
LTYTLPVTKFEGIHDIYLKFNGYASILQSIVFKKSVETPIKSFTSSIHQGICFYPNPARGFLTILSPPGSYVDIYSMQGQLLQVEKITKVEQTILLNQLKSGNYIIKLISPTEVGSEVLIIE